MATGFAVSEKLDIGRVIQATFGVIQRNLVPFLILSTVFAGLPALVVGWSQVAMTRGASPDGVYMSALFGGLASLVATAVLQGALIQLTVADLNGRPVTAADGFATGLRNFLPLIGVSILSALGIMFATLLFIVPGVIVALMWCVATPVLIIERAGITSAFGRSRALTSGSRWRILGLVAVYLIAAIVLQMVIRSLSGGFGSLGQQAANAPVTVIGNTLTAIISNLVGAAGGAVLYTELRRIRDGVGASELASIFD